MSLIRPKTKSEWTLSGFIIMIFLGLATPMMIQITMLVALDRAMTLGSDTGVPIIIITLVSICSALGACWGFLRIERGIGG